MKKKKRTTLEDYVRACRKASREEEIREHGRPAGYGRIHRSKKVYDRNRMKAGDKSLPYLFPHATTARRLSA